MYENLSLYIDGQFLQGEGRREQDIVNPATDEVIAKLPHASQADLDRALQSAQRAFGTWRKSSPLERSNLSILFCSRSFGEALLEPYQP